MKNINKSWFSIIEIMIGIFIFSIWIISVYSLIITTLKLNDYNKNYIIAANLAREQVELVRNIRDSNYEKIQVYNQINPSTDNHSNQFQIWKNYRIENNFSTNPDNFPVKVTEIIDFWEWESEIATKMQSYRLCLNSQNLYTFDCVWNKETPFYRYISIEPVEYKEWVNTKVVDWAFNVKSKVIWYSKWYNEFELNNIFTDFKRF